MATTRFLHTPDGVRDICNEECLQKLVLEDRLQTAMRNYGYHSIQTPTFEYFDVQERLEPFHPVNYTNFLIKRAIH